MRVRIDHAVANDADAHGWLDRILHKVSDGWHLWDTTQELDTSAFEATSWINNRGTKGDEIFRLLQASIRQGAWNFSLHNRQINVTNNPSCSNEFNPEEAARLAEMPVIILVENRHSDGLFLKKVVDVLDRTLSRYWNLPGGPVQIDSVGGIGQMPLEISEKMNRYSNNMRFVAICDSDKSGPFDAESNYAVKLRNVCRQHSVPCWVLAKRSIENYIIKILLELWKSNDFHHTRLIEAWNRLNADQKNYYDMKKGLPNDRDNIIRPLYNDLSEENYTVLIDGFGRDVYGCWQYLDDDHKIELRTRSQGDLEHGISLIRKQI